MVCGHDVERGRIIGMGSALKQGRIRFTFSP